MIALEARSRGSTSSWRRRERGSLPECCCKRTDWGLALRWYMPKRHDSSVSPEWKRVQSSASTFQGCCRERGRRPPGAPPGEPLPRERPPPHQPCSRWAWPVPPCYVVMSGRSGFGGEGSGASGQASAVADRLAARAPAQESESPEPDPEEPQPTGATEAVSLTDSWKFGISRAGGG